MRHRREIEAKSLAPQRVVLPEHWESILADTSGTTFRGIERVASAMLFGRLGIPDDIGARQQAGRRVKPIMQRLGWHGPKKMRVIEHDRTHTGIAGYWRYPRKLGAAIAPVDFDGDNASPLSEELPDALEHVTRLGLAKLARVLRAPSDLNDASLTRAQVTAAGIAVNAQLRADEQRLRAKVTGDVLGRLLAAIETERKRRESEGDA